MSTRYCRVAKAVSLPRITRRMCSKCGVVNEKPTGQKCKLVNRELFTDEDAEHSNNKTSTPLNEGIVNRIVSPIIAPVVNSNNV